MLRPLFFLTVLTVTAATTAHTQWTIQATHTTADLRGIDNVDHGVAWASGTDGTILRTIDDGEHWQLCAKPPNGEHLDFRAVQAFDNSTAIIMSSGKGDLSRLYKTTDGCQTWHLLFTNPDKDGFWDALSSSSPDKALVLGDSVDGKMRLWSWQSDQEPGNELDLKVIKGQASFAASNSVLEQVRFPQSDRRWNYELRIAAGTADAVGLFIKRTEHTPTCEPCVANLQWIPVPMSQGNTTSGIFSFAFRNQLHGIAVGGDYEHPDSKIKTSSSTSDGGQHWTAAITPPHGYRSAVAYDVRTKTWITVGPNGTDISTDDGRNWRALQPSPGEAADTAQHWNALSLPYAVGPHGRIATLRPSALTPPK